MRLWYLLFLVYCLKQKSVVNCFDFADPLIDAAELYKETAKLSSDLVKNIEPLLLTYEDAFDEISDDFSEKIKPLLKKIGDHLCDHYLTFNGLNETKNLFLKTVEDFNLSNLTDVCSDESLISNIAGGANSLICDEEESLIGVSNKARKTLQEYMTNAISLRSSTANLLYHKTNELTKIALDQIKDHKYHNSFWGYSIDYREIIEREVFTPFDKCLKKITTSPKEIMKCVKSVYDEMNESVRVRSLNDLEDDKKQIYVKLLKEYETLLGRVITVTKIIDEKMLSVTKNIIDGFFQDENKCFNDNFLYKLNQYRQKIEHLYINEVFMDSENLLHIDVTTSAKNFDLALEYLEAVVSYINVPDRFCDITEYAGKVRNVLCEVYDKTAFIFDKATNKIMKPIEKIESFIPCFIKHIGNFVVDKTEEFIDEIGLQKIIDDVEEEVSNVVDASVSILKPFFEEFGSGCGKILEEFEASLEDLPKDIKQCDLLKKIDQLNDSCSKPSSIKNSQSINKNLKELPNAATQLKTCVQKTIANKATGIYKAMEKCKINWHYIFSA